ncbi:unnamed protein product [Symbiodinium sp. CCMP2592]|nr:unnamed protein product [Symbiodinium sp. CCMP2592]
MEDPGSPVSQSGGIPKSKSQQSIAGASGRDHRKDVHEAHEKGFHFLEGRKPLTCRRTFNDTEEWADVPQDMPSTMKAAALERARAARAEARGEGFGASEGQSKEEEAPQDSSVEKAAALEKARAAMAAAQNQDESNHDTGVDRAKQAFEEEEKARKAAALERARRARAAESSQPNGVEAPQDNGAKSDVGMDRARQAFEEEKAREAAALERARRRSTVILSKDDELEVPREEDEGKGEAKTAAKTPHEAEGRRDAEESKEHRKSNNHLRRTGRAQHRRLQQAQRAAALQEAAGVAELRQQVDRLRSEASEVDELHARLAQLEAPASVAAVAAPAVSGGADGWHHADSDADTMDPDVLSKGAELTLGEPAVSQPEAGVAIAELEKLKSEAAQPIVQAHPLHVQSQRAQQVQLMLDVVVASGSANTKFSSMELRDRTGVLPLFVRLLDKVSAARISALLDTLKRWIRYAECHVAADVPYWMPPAMCLAAFLQQVSKGCPTAPVTVYHNLKWWVDRLGLPLPIDDPLVAMFKCPPDGYAAK